MVAALVGELQKHSGVVVAEATGQCCKAVVIGLGVVSLCFQCGAEVVRCGMEPSKGKKDVDRGLHVVLGLGGGCSIASDTIHIVRPVSVVYPL